MIGAASGTRTCQEESILLLRCVHATSGFICPPWDLLWRRWVATPYPMSWANSTTVPCTLLTSRLQSTKITKDIETFYLQLLIAGARPIIQLLAVWFLRGKNTHQDQKSGADNVIASQGYNVTTITFQSHMTKQVYSSHQSKREAINIWLQPASSSRGTHSPGLLFLPFFQKCFPDQTRYSIHRDTVLPLGVESACSRGRYT